MPNHAKMIDMSQDDSDGDDEVQLLKTLKKKRRRAIVDDDDDEDNGNIPSTSLPPPNKDNIDRRTLSPTRQKTQDNAVGVKLSPQGPSAQLMAQKPAASDASKEKKLQKFLATQRQQGVTAKPPTSTSLTRPNAEAVVIQDLRDICHKFRLPYNNAPPLLQIPTKKRVDLFGSFLYDEAPNQRQPAFDFFDTNDRGEIVLSAPPRIFPEEFVESIGHSTKTAASEYGPTWWGIIEPTLGVGKYKAPLPHPSTARSESSSAKAARDPTAPPVANGNQGSVGAMVAQSSQSHRGNTERVDHQRGNQREWQQRPVNVQNQPHQHRTGRSDEPSRHPSRR